MKTNSGGDHSALLECSDGEEDLFSGDSQPASTTTRQRNIVYICIGLNSVLVAAAISLMMPIMTIEAEKKNPDLSVGKHASVGLIFSVAKFTEFLTAPLLASELDNIGSKYLLVLSTLGVGGCLLVFGFVSYIEGWTQFLVLSYLIRIVQGAFTVANFVAVYVIIVSVLPDHLSFANGSIRAFNGFGYAFGPFLGGVLYAVSGFTVSFVTGAGLLFVTGAFLVVALPSIDSDHGSIPASPKPKISHRRILAVPWVWVAGGTLFLGNFILGAIESTLPLYFQRAFGSSTAVSGLAFFFFGILYGIVAPLVGYIVDRKFVSLRTFQISGLVVVGLACQLVGPALYLHWPRSMVLSFMSMVLVAEGTACLNVLGVVDVTRALSEHGVGTPLELRYAVAGFTRAALALGYASGPVVGSSIVAALNFQTGFALIGLVYFGVAAFISALCLVSYLKSYSKSVSESAKPAEGQELIDSKHPESRE